MALIVETGSNVANSNAYITVAEADAYHTLMNNLSWVGVDADKENAIINATAAVDLLYGERYLSLPQYSDQSLLFPRFSFVINGRQVVNPGTIPKQLKNAVAEIALKYISGEDVYPTPNNEGSIRSNMVRIGDIEIQNQYGQLPKAEKYSGFNKVDIILRPILRQNTTPSYMAL